MKYSISPVVEDYRNKWWKNETLDVTLLSSKETPMFFNMNLFRLNSHLLYRELIRQYRHLRNERNYFVDRSKSRIV
jgi:hypothetical protein